VVFGGTGGTGSECVVQALAAGAKVTVLARDPSKLAMPPGTGGEAGAGQPISNPNLTVVQGNVTSAADVAKCITAATTGVVIALGGKTKDVGTTMLTDGTTNVITAMKAIGVKRVGSGPVSLSTKIWWSFQMGGVQGLDQAGPAPPPGPLSAKPSTQTPRGRGVQPDVDPSGRVAFGAQMAIRWANFPKMYNVYTLYTKAPKADYVV